MILIRKSLHFKSLNIKIAASNFHKQLKFLIYTRLEVALGGENTQPIVLNWRDVTVSFSIFIK
jgi:hypothetical protein